MFDFIISFVMCLFIWLYMYERHKRIQKENFIEVLTLIHKDLQVEYKREVLSNIEACFEESNNA